MMAHSPPKKHTLAARVKVRAFVELASDCAAQTWPIHTFISRNPLHDLEHLDFEKAVQEGKTKIGGDGYLSNATYRRYFESGRIKPAHLDPVLEALATAQDILLAGRTLTQLEVLRVHFLDGLTAPAPEILEMAVQNSPDRDILFKLAEKISPTIEGSALAQRFDQFLAMSRETLGRKQSLSQWFERQTGQALGEEINQEMIKWCLPFLDEGQAPWTLPKREEGLYACWKKLVAAELCGESSQPFPETAAEMVLDCLEAMGLPEDDWEAYLGLHLSALPGWTAVIKWRSQHKSYAWQDACPIDLLQYLAIRLYVERKTCEQLAQQEMSIPANIERLLSYIETHQSALFLKTEWREGRLSPLQAKQVARLSHLGGKSTEVEWKKLARSYVKENAPRDQQRAALAAAWQLHALSKSLKFSSETLIACSESKLQQVLQRITAHPESEHGRHWLAAFEMGYQENILRRLSRNVSSDADSKSAKVSRPATQAVFCIDVRSESFRRHFEAAGAYESFGFAGFFSAFIQYAEFGSHHEVNLFPAVGSAKNAVQEIPLPSEEKKVPRHRAGTAFLHASHTLLHDLKENVITPYVMVESIGWFFGIPLIGKTLFPNQYRKGTLRLKRWLAPPLATTLTTEKISRRSVDRSIAQEQQITIRQALKAQNIKSARYATPEQIALLRKLAMHHSTALDLLETKDQKSLLRLFPEASGIDDFVKILREQHFITEAWASARMERITRTGFSDNEQILTIKTMLEVMGFTKNFARLVLFCGHGSTSANNPYEAALDCGACGGNEGGPNARVVAKLANKASVREALKQTGLVIPDDTYFIAGLHNTTTDEVRLYDLETLPDSHQEDLIALQAGLRKAGENNSLERCGKFSDIDKKLNPESAALEVKERSATWHQTRPEWGLSGNAAIVISKGSLIKGVDLEGRVFLHSYRQEDDAKGQGLEVIMTGALVVAQWINMEYYFSTTDNESYGSGSKIYHNVAGRIGLMYGASSDLRTGLPWQTVGNGDMPYHEAMRLFTVIEAPRDRITTIIKQHTVLKTHFENDWVHLVALDQDRFYRYQKNGIWQLETHPA